jgi:hypothetical protein
MLHRQSSVHGAKRHFCVLFHAMQYELHLVTSWSLHDMNIQGNRDQTLRVPELRNGGESDKYFLLEIITSTTSRKFGHRNLNLPVYKCCMTLSSYRNDIKHILRLWETSVLFQTNLMLPEIMHETVQLVSLIVLASLVVMTGTSSFSSMALQPSYFVGLGRFFSSLIYKLSVRLLDGWSACRKATYTQDNTNTE